MEFQVGNTYSGYQFLDILKRSKNGIEFRVRNTLLGRVEALRVLPESAQKDADQSERFMREMRVHAGLVHPNIVTLFNAIELEDHLVITTELVEGPVLAEKLMLGPLPWVSAIALTRQLLSALTYAHQQRIVHRDISPDNIVVRTDGVVKLANFALAKSAGSPKLTQVGSVIGNLKYISPEQIKGMGNIDGRSDLYSLGMVLYEMLCGRPAFDATSQFELMAAHVNRPPTPPDQVNPAVPQPLSVVVLKALSKDPTQRYQTATEFDEALARVGETPIAARPEPAAIADAITNPGNVSALAAVNVTMPVDSRHGAPPQAVIPPPASVPPPTFLAAATSRGARRTLIVFGAAGGCLAGSLAVLWLILK